MKRRFPNPVPGQVFHSLKVLNEVAPNNKMRQFRCLCICGSTTIVRMSSLNIGKAKSCGCLIAKSATTHNQSRTRLYKTWIGMKSRCYNSKDKGFIHYGGRGIQIADEWHSFQPFMDWALNNGYQESLTIERKDVNGNYSPSNCTWATISDQNKNRTNTVHVTYNGETLCVKDWSRKLGISAYALFNRLKKFSVHEAFTNPVRGRRV